MRIRLFLAFVCGFVVGVVSLTLGLWSSGTLTRSVSATTVSSVPAADERPEIPPPPSMPAESLSKGPPSSVQAAMAAPAPPESVTQPPGDAGSLPSLSMPVEGIDPAALTDTFSETHAGHAHEAQDIMAARGTPVLAVDEGNVVKLFTSKEGGLTVYQFNNAREYCYYYAHLDRYAPGLKEGTLLRRGDLVGYVGSTGNASADAPHLHFAVFKLGPEREWWKGTAIDPLPLLRRR